VRGGIFVRTFAAFLMATLATVALFTVTLAATLQAQRQESYEDEVRQQAREVAEYMSHLNQLQFVRENTTMQFVIRRKLTHIHDRYNADIWIVSYNSGQAQILDSSWNTSEYATSEAVALQLQSIYQGSEIRVQGLFPELGDEIVTIGVPWTYSEGHVVGAVLLHISTESLRVKLTDVLPALLPAGLGVLALGIALSFILARSQTNPLNELIAAVRDFSRGELGRRVELHCGGELQALGEEINKMAFALSTLEESRRGFVASVSHELRSPLTCIQGYVQALRDGTFPEEDREKYMGVVLDETARLTNLVNDLLDLSRFESGKFPLNLMRLDINELIRRTLLRFEPRIDEKRANVEADFPDEPGYVEADPERIQQVVGNLIDNALKFLPDGGTLSVGARREGKRVVAWVRDSGPGISTEDLPFIFDRFYKADKAHTSGMGTGLGLSIVKRILEQHGTDISVDSKPGETVFRFSLPAADEKKAG
jgi:signal transduction histidine kinase